MSLVYFLQVLIHFLDTFQYFSIEYLKGINYFSVFKFILNLGFLGLFRVNLLLNLVSKF